MLPRRLPGSSVWFVVLCVLSSASGVAAQPAQPAAGSGVAEVEALVQQGLALRRDHRDQEALDVFLRARQRSNEPRIVAQIGFAEQALGRWVDADAHLREARTRDDDPWVSQRRTVIDEALGVIDQRLGRLEVSTNVAGATVLIDGREAGRTPFSSPIRVVAGTVNLEVQAQGYVSVRRSLTVTPQNLSRERVELTAAVAQRVVPPPPPPTPEPPPPNVHAYRPFAIAAAVAGGVGLAFGAFALAQRNSEADAFNNDGACLVNGRSRSENCGDHADAVGTWEGLSIAGFAVGGALGVTAAVLFVIDSGAPRPAAQPNAGPAPRRSLRGLCGPGPTPVGLSCAWRF